MMKIKDNLCAILVPIDAKEFRVHSMTYAFSYLFNCDENDICDLYVSEPDYISHGDWEILGTVTKDDVSFDCGIYCDNNLHLSLDGLGLFNNYLTNECEFENPEDSIRSLIEFKSGMVWVNPLGDYSVAHKRHILTGTWQRAEDGLLKKVVIIKKQ